MRCSPARLAKTTADTGHRGRARAHSPPRTPRTASAHRLRATRLRAPRSPSPGLALWTAPRIRPPAVAVRCQPPTHPQPIDRDRIACRDTSPATRIDGLFFLFSALGGGVRDDDLPPPSREQLRRLAQDVRQGVSDRQRDAGRISDLGSRFHLPSGREHIRFGQARDRNADVCFAVPGTIPARPPLIRHRRLAMPDTVPIQAAQAAAPDAAFGAEPPRGGPSALAARPRLGSSPAAGPSISLATGPRRLRRAAGVLGRGARNRVGDGAAQPLPRVPVPDPGRAGGPHWPRCGARPSDASGDDGPAAARRARRAPAASLQADQAVYVHPVQENLPGKEALVIGGACVSGRGGGGGLLDRRGGGASWGLYASWGIPRGVAGCAGRAPEEPPAGGVRRG